jgi:hypothetical protein
VRGPDAIATAGVHRFDHLISRDDFRRCQCKVTLPISPGGSRVECIDPQLSPGCKVLFCSVDLGQSVHRSLVTELRHAVITKTNGQELIGPA